MIETHERKGDFKRMVKSGRAKSSAFLTAWSRFLHFLIFT